MLCRCKLTVREKWNRTKSWTWSVWVSTRKKYLNVEKRSRCGVKFAVAYGFLLQILSRFLYRTRHKSFKQLSGRENKFGSDESNEPTAYRHRVPIFICLFFAVLRKPEIFSLCWRLTNNGTEDHVENFVRKYLTSRRTLALTLKCKVVGNKFCSYVMRERILIRLRAESIICCMDCFALSQQLCFISPSTSTIKTILRLETWTRENWKAKNSNRTVFRFGAARVIVALNLSITVYSWSVAATYI